MIYRFLFFIMLVSFFAACKKYPEGGLHVFAKLKLEKNDSRHLYWWGIQKFEVNGFDSTDHITSGDPGIRTQYVQFFEMRYTNYASTIYSGADYEFDLINNKKNLSIDGGSKSGVDKSYPDTTIKIRRVLTPYGVHCDWEILQLKRKEMILRSNSGGNTYILELKRQ